MGWYVVKRLLLIVPTLIGIVAVNFFIVHLAPGGPVDQMISRLLGENTGQSTSRIAGASQALPGAVIIDPGARSQFAGAQALDPKLIEAGELEFYNFMWENAMAASIYVHEGVWPIGPRLDPNFEPADFADVRTPTNFESVRHR